mgnify:FL=1
MARKIAGAEVLLKVKKGDELIEVTGQQGLTVNLSADTIDTTDKTSGGWKTAMAGLREWSIDQDVFYTVGDESNKLLLDAYLNREAIVVDVLAGKAGEAGAIHFTGDAYITSFPFDFSLDNAASVSMSLSGASALTVEVTAETTP